MVAAVHSFPHPERVSAFEVLSGGRDHGCDPRADDCGAPEPPAELDHAPEFVDRVLSLPASVEPMDAPVEPMDPLLVERTLQNIGAEAGTPERRARTAPTESSRTTKSAQKRQRQKSARAKQEAEQQKEMTRMQKELRSKGVSKCENGGTKTEDGRDRKRTEDEPRGKKRPKKERA